MPIDITCTCGKKLRLKESLQGKRIRCPECDDVLVVPEKRSSPVKRKANSRRRKPQRKNRPPVVEQVEDYDDFEPPLPPTKKRKKKRRKESRFPAAALIAVVSVVALVSGVGILGYKYLPTIIADVQNGAVNSLSGNDESGSAIASDTNAERYSVEGRWQLDWEKTIAATSDPARKVKLGQMAEISDPELVFRANGQMEIHIVFKDSGEKLKNTATWKHGAANQINGYAPNGSIAHIMTFEGPDQLRKITDGNAQTFQIFVRSQ